MSDVGKILGAIAAISALCALLIGRDSVHAWSISTTVDGVAVVDEWSSASYGSVGDPLEASPVATDTPVPQTSEAPAPTPTDQESQTATPEPEGGQGP